MSSSIIDKLSDIDKLSIASLKVITGLIIPHNKSDSWNYCDESMDKYLIAKEQQWTKCELMWIVFMFISQVSCLSCKMVKLARITLTSAVVTTLLVCGSWMVTAAAAAKGKMMWIQRQITLLCMDTTLDWKQSILTHWIHQLHVSR